MKNEIIGRVLNAMCAELDAEQMQKLKQELIIVLHDVDIINSCTDITVGDVGTSNEYYLERYSVDLIVQQKSDKTIQQYVYTARKFLNALGKSCLNVTYEDVSYYFAKMVMSKSKSKVTMDNDRRFLKSFFKFLVEHDYINTDPFAKMKPIRYAEKEKVFLTDMEVETLRDSCRTIKELALVDLLMATGIRVGELSSLDVSDVDFEKGEIRVYGSKTKSWRTVFLDARTKKHLQEYLNRRRGNEIVSYGDSKVKRNPLFLARGQVRLKPYGINSLISKIVARTNLTKHITVHTFRRTLATRLCRKGMAIEKIAVILGHSSVNTTIKYYLTILDIDLKAEYAKMA